MDGLTVVTADERNVTGAYDEIHRGAWPEFATHDPVWAQHEYLMQERAPEFQFVAFDEHGTPVALGNAMPFVWDGTDAHLPDGIDGVLRAAATMFDAGRSPTAVSALQIVVRRDRLGLGLSATCIRLMGELVARHGMHDLVAPVRPTQKHRYPLIALDRYARWRRADGTLFDPWLRVHERAGARSVQVCPSSMTIPGTIAQWEAWTGMAFPETGTYVVPDALVPVEIDVERDRGVYVEPNFWMHHRV